MSKASQPELKKFMDKRLFIHLQGGRKISGVLRGFDIFLNLVVDDAVEETVPAEKHPIGQVETASPRWKHSNLLDSGPKKKKKGPSGSDRLDCINFTTRVHTRPSGRSQASGLGPLQAGVTLTQTMSHSIFPPNTGPKLPPDFSSLVIQGPYPPSAPIHLCLSHLQSGPKSNKAVLISSSSKHLSSQLEEYSDLWLHEHAMSGAIAEHLHQTDILYVDALTLPSSSGPIDPMYQLSTNAQTPPSTLGATPSILHPILQSRYKGMRIPSPDAFSPARTVGGPSCRNKIRPRFVLFDTNLVDLALPFFQPVFSSQIDQVPTSRKARATEALKKVIGWIGTVERVDEIPSSQADETELTLNLTAQVEKEHYRLTLESTTSAETSAVHWHSFRDTEPGPFSAIRTTRVQFG
ncbi:hypothetical protein RHS04_03034 [Rhizoctonia solani]|uniref:Sm protein G n=1 Tax=Rhizoctonia solani TaxID=456999 RepID=A0A8H7HBY1_9AGAM|nr:hypothetical protein RHS04_03034 [Rhizoctonia solani]